MSDETTLLIDELIDAAIQYGADNYDETYRTPKSETTSPSRKDATRKTGPSLQIPGQGTLGE